MLFFSIVGPEPEVQRKGNNSQDDTTTKDSRLTVSGKFFFVPRKEKKIEQHDKQSSNSILLQRTTKKPYLYLEEDHESLLAFLLKRTVETTEKECQTESIRTGEAKVDFQMQVNPDEIKKSITEQRKSRWTSSSTQKQLWKPLSPLRDPTPFEVLPSTSGLSTITRPSSTNYSKENDDNDKSSKDQQKFPNWFARRKPFQGRANLRKARSSRSKSSTRERQE